MQQCAVWGTEQREICTAERDEGYNRCTREEDQGYSRCDSWGWFAFICVVATWVVKMVCVAWTWVSNVVCVAWSVITDAVCVLWITLTSVAERVWTWIRIIGAALFLPVAWIVDLFVRHRFDACDAALMARVADVSYDSPADVNDRGTFNAVFASLTVPAGGAPRFQVIDFVEELDPFFRFDTQAYVLFDPLHPGGRIIVAFRGTEFDKKPLEDLILTDLDAVPTLCDIGPPPLIVHEGFWRAYHAVEPRLIKVVFDALTTHGPLPVFFVGHSLGGALASLAAFRFRRYWIQEGAPVLLRTYGAPRVGGRAFSETMHVLVPEALHFYNTGDDVSIRDPWPIQDPVTLIPFKWMGYVHQFPRVRLKDNGRFVMQPRMTAEELLPGAPVWDVGVVIGNLAANLDYHALSRAPASRYGGGYVERLERICDD